ncbi:MAG: DUF3224 domain-containing protein [Gemmatimonadales bacterium]|nr:DUF3224 domain-containing protein [Gemmatimonadales bacterium]
MMTKNMERVVVGAAPRWILLSVCALAVSACAQAGARSPGLEAPPRAAMLRFIDAVNARDLDRMTAAFAADVTAFVPTAQADRVDGKVALSRIFAEFVAAAPAAGARPVVPEDIAVRAGRDMAVASFNVRDAATRRVNRRSFVFRREGSRWLITHFHASMAEESMTTRAEGSFDVTIAPIASHHTDDPPLARMSLDKVFHGDLDGTSRGEMLAVQSAVKGSAAYVAIERVTGTLHGRAGSFALQHSGVMNRGQPSLSVTIVPDSGTEALEGISGSLEIIIEGGRHGYVLSYTLPPD